MSQSDRQCLIGLGRADEFRLPRLDLDMCMLSLCARAKVLICSRSELRSLEGNVLPGTAGSGGTHAAETGSDVLVLLLVDVNVA